MKQVNMTLSDEAYAILVKEAAKRQLESGKVIKIASLAAELFMPVVNSLNGNSPAETPTQDTKPEEKQENKQELPNPLADLDF
jgi:hypothetical protein